MKQLTKTAIRQILACDKAGGFGPEGKESNRNRFYIWLTKFKSDVIVRTVAVKARSKEENPIVKEVIRAGITSDTMEIKDLSFYQIAGYTVDWSPEGIGPAKLWNYDGQWESEAYSRSSGLWKIKAPVVNPELLKKTKRFRYSVWDESNQGNILDYLKIFDEHPEIEMLSKLGLGRYTTKRAIVNRLKKNLKFRQFFMQNLDEIRDYQPGINVIYRAYREKISLSEAQKNCTDKRLLSDHGCPKAVDASKALDYLGRHCNSNDIIEYCVYLMQCEYLGMDLTDTKVAFPHDLAARAAHVNEEHTAAKRIADAKKYAKINKKLKVVAHGWSVLEKTKGKWTVMLPRSVDDFTQEGRNLMNCLGPRHAIEMAEGKLIIVFVRDASAKDKSYVAVEFRLPEGQITQCYGKNNSKPPQEVFDFVNRVFQPYKVAA